MQKIESNRAETKSLDIVATNVVELKRLFPESVVEGRIDFDVLKQVLGAAVDEREEKYGLNWHGKRLARQAALQPSTGTLRPCHKESTEWETTQNVIIEGDNLEVLKLLQKSFHGQVRVVYIDPPYNTGNDFIYPDDFTENLTTYLQYTGQVDAHGRKFSTNTESSGRFHSKWLSMMYPRLFLARNLLRQDGVIFISIDDHEVENLRKLCNEIFGEENFIATLCWEKAYTANQTAKFVSDTHDYVVMYARDANSLELGRLARTPEQEAKFKNPDGDPRGPWKAENLSAGKFYSAGQFKITGPTGLVFGPPPGRYWRCNEAQYEKWLADGRITFGQDGTGRPMLKKFLNEMEAGLTPTTWCPHAQFGSNKEASIELKSLFDGRAVFDTPKPVKLIKKLIEIAGCTDGIIMDFFAGCGTTGQAVLELNAGDNGERRYILVQLPEPTELVDLPTIADISKERMRRVREKLKDQAPDSDLGFRVFKLDSSNIRSWEPDSDDLAHSILDAVEHLKSDRSEQDILFELLLKLGLDPTVSMESKELGGKEIHSIGEGALMVCLAKQINSNEVESVAMGIVSWNKELAPVGEVTCIFRDSAFTDDVAKANLTAILQQHGLESIRSL